MNSAKSVLLITGATGSLGKRIAREALKATSVEKIILLIRADSDQQARLRVQDLTNSKTKIEILSADITKNNLDLKPHTYKKLSREVTEILHCAASVRFTTSLAEARLTNYQGTSNVLEFAKKCSNLSKIGYVSTAFVAGKRKGIILENELEHKSGFINSYERSKYEAELLVRESFKYLPIIVFRPTIILDPETRSSVSYLLKLFWDSSLPILPGNKNAIVDLVNADYAAFVIWRVFENYFSRSKTYHISAGAENSFTLNEIVEKVRTEFLKKRPLRAPRLVNLTNFQTLLLSPITKIDIGVFKKIGKFATQLLYPKIFDHTNLRSLNDQKLLPAHIGKYFQTYLESFLERETNGRKN